MLLLHRESIFKCSENRTQKQVRWFRMREARNVVLTSFEHHMMRGWRRRAVALHAGEDSFADLAGSKCFGMRGERRLVNHENSEMHFMNHQRIIINKNTGHVVHRQVQCCTLVI